ncbi:MAG: LacI family transcriptional regulator [Propionibacteriaceae bacterium]|jgi:LacI family transcriptional regulator|nr:LacI family transcriptional regulator [Propionibacteriaceae bacterium]
MTGDKPVTLAEVAAQAGVSIATASKALNGRDQVRASTKDRVLQSARELGFTPNALAKGLLSGRSGTVGLVTHDLEGRFSIPILMGVEDAFGAEKTSVFLTDARGDAIRERYQIEALLGRRVDGIIVVGEQTNNRPSISAGIPVPVVYAYAPSDNPADCSVAFDNVGAGRLSVEHLIACGRSRIAIITGDPTYGAAQERAIGAQRALDEAGLKLVGEPTFGTWTESWGRGATRLLMAQHPEVDAILCGSDLIARGVLDALRERGLEVPGDVAVMGHDNWEVLASGARVPLTSVDMNLEQLGRRAATRLAEAIAGNPHAGVDLIEGRVVTRKSTAPLD